MARHAGISKGGLLYHFPSKAHLIRALLARYEGEAPHAFAEANHDAAAVCGTIDPRAVAVLIAAAEQPSLLDPIVGKEAEFVTLTEKSVTRRWRILTRALERRLPSPDCGESAREKGAEKTQ